MSSGCLQNDVDQLRVASIYTLKHLGLAYALCCLKLPEPLIIVYRAISSLVEDNFDLVCCMMRFGFFF